MNNELIDLPFDQYQRYRIVEETAGIIRRDLNRPLRVLDVGGYAEGIARPPFLPAPLFLPTDEVLVCDRREFSDPHYLKADGCALPFENGQFDLVISCDVMEHVPPQNRVAILGEMTRVAGRYALIAAPFFDEESDLAEKLFYEYHLLYAGHDLPNINEHREYGLPRLELIRELCEANQWAWTYFDSGYAPRWLLMAFLSHFSVEVLGSSEFYKKLQSFYNLNFFEIDQCRPGYRKVALIATQGTPAVLNEFKERFSGPATRHFEIDYRPAELLFMLLQFERHRFSSEHLRKSEDHSSGICGEILPNNPLRFRIYCSVDFLARVDLFLATFGKVPQSDLTFRIIEVSSGTEKAQINLPASNLLDNRWHAFRFAPIRNSAAKDFEIRLESRTATSGDAITAYITGAGIPCYRLYTVTEADGLGNSLSDNVQELQAQLKVVQAQLGAEQMKRTLVERELESTRAEFDQQLKEILQAI